MEERFLAVFQALDHERRLMEKQLAKLTELVESSPVVQQKGATAMLGPHHAGTTFVIIHRESIEELVKSLKLEVECLRYGLEACVSPTGADWLERWTGGTNERDTE